MVFRALREIEHRLQDAETGRLVRPPLDSEYLQRWFRVTTAFGGGGGLDNGEAVTPGEGTLARVGIPTATGSWVEDVSGAPTEEIRGELFYGYAFETQIVRAERINGDWWATGHGIGYVYGTLDEDMEDGADASMTVIINDGPQQITVNGIYGASASGAKIGALWSNAFRRWHAALEACT